ncbi:hypothetical protein HF521_014996 [Silurus meridionalis]|uniref:SPEF2 C-terminal domain-containing protein n=1 Tax=Silurus meridionalis TaxID=175797 RepID=A0A8T0A7A5_SILME|nr:hypothetical protein HF521_014996 [Silurus meridionalis]
MREWKELWLSEKPLYEAEASPEQDIELRNSTSSMSRTSLTTWKHWKLMAQEKLDRRYAIRRVPSGEGWVLDGFPVDISQARLLEKALGGDEPDQEHTEGQHTSHELAVDRYGPQAPPTSSPVLQLAVLLEVSDEQVLERHQRSVQEKEMNTELTVPPAGESQEQTQVQHRIVGFQDSWSRLEDWFGVEQKILVKLNADEDEDTVYRALETVLLHAMDTAGNGPEDTSEIGDVMKADSNDYGPAGESAAEAPPLQPGSSSWVYVDDQIPKAQLRNTLAHFKEIDTEGGGVITLQQYLQVDLWFPTHRELPVPDSTKPQPGDRLTNLRKFFFTLFSDSAHSPPVCDYMNMLLYFCSHPDPAHGFTRALSLVTQHTLRYTHTHSTGLLQSYVTGDVCDEEEKVFEGDEGGVSVDDVLRVVTHRGAPISSHTTVYNTEELKQDLMEVFERLGINPDTKIPFNLLSQQPLLQQLMNTSQYLLRDLSRVLEIQQSTSVEDPAGEIPSTPTPGEAPQ